MTQHRPRAVARTANSHQNFVAWWATSMWICTTAYLLVATLTAY